jgi:hypothetical protein
MGKADDVPVGGCDFDGDGEDDVAVYNEKTGRWQLEMSTDGSLTKDFGFAGAVAVGAPSFEATGDHLPIIYPADFNGTLWKTPNHSGSGTVVLVASRFMADYQAGLWEGAVVSSDPSGDNVLPLGVGRIVAPYHERPAIRFDTLGASFRPGPVYFVIKYKDGRRQPWYLPDPGVRTE